MSVISLKTRQKYGSLLAGNPFYVPPSFESIATVTATGSANTITFDSIPNTFQHLQLRIMTRGTANGGTNPLILFVRANGVSTTAYDWHALSGDGSAASTLFTASANRMHLAYYADSGYAANIFGVTIIDIHDYQSTTKNKTFRSFSGVDRNNTTGGQVALSSGQWRNTAAITSLTITNNGGDNFSSSSSFALYGIKG